MFDEVLSNLVSVGVGSAATYAWGTYRTRRRAAGQSAILSGLDDPLFVFPPRAGPPEKILPQVAIEDFMAINNMISAFLLAGRQAKIRVRDAPNLGTDDRENNNLILICSTRTNPVTSDALSALREERPPGQRELIPIFQNDASTGETYIAWNEGSFRSKSYKQLSDAKDRAQGPGDRAAMDQVELEDIAVIVKARSPWSKTHRVLIVAGIRGIGTWGAAECLKKWWKPIYRAKGSTRRIGGPSKTGDFAALVHVVYRNYDIKEGTRMIHFADLDTPTVNG